MSGVSLLPPVNESSEADKVAQQAGSSSLIASVRAIELQLVAFVVVFSATGFVPVLDLVFPTLASLYLVALSRLAFPSTTSSSQYRVEAQQQSSGSLFRVYRVVGAIVGLLLPLAYALGGLAGGDERAVRSVTPHLFLLSCQILTEIVASGASLFSPPVTALVPLLYSVRRISIILDWIGDVWVNQSLPVEPQVHEVIRGWQGFGKWLAVGNLVYSSTNLLFFLIPSSLPAAFERYFRERDEGDKKIKMRSEDDKPSAGSGSNLLKKKIKKSD